MAKKKPRKRASARTLLGGARSSSKISRMPQAVREQLREDYNNTELTYADIADRVLVSTCPSSIRTLVRKRLADARKTVDDAIESEEVGKTSRYSQLDKERKAVWAWACTQPATRKAIKAGGQTPVYITDSSISRDYRDEVMYATQLAEQIELYGEAFDRLGNKVALGIPMATCQMLWLKISKGIRHAESLEDLAKHSPLIQAASSAFRCMVQADKERRAELNPVRAAAEDIKRSLREQLEGHPELADQLAAIIDKRIEQEDDKR